MNRKSDIPGYDAEAEFYDYAWESFKPDTEFYRRRLRRQDQVLDCMCGTGRVAIALARAGFQVQGIDSSEEMLRRARQKSRKESPRVRQRLRWQRGNLAKVKLGSGHDAAIIAANSYGLIVPTRDRVRALRQIHASLRPGGKLILAIDSVRSYRRIRNGVPFVSIVRHLDSGGRLYVQVMAESGSEARRVASSTLHLILAPSGKLQRSQVTQTVTAVLSPGVVRTELKRAGFRPEKLFGGYDERPYSASGDRFIIEAVAK